MKSKVKILDGGMGTSLSDMGLDLSGTLWSARVLIENPSAIKLVHTQHARAGADILTSASYQASPDGFQNAGYKANDYLKAIEVSMTLARESAAEVGAEQERKILVAASIGPYGATLADGSEYHGDYDKSKEFLTDFHATRLEEIVKYEPDYLAFETVPSIVEVEVINELLLNEFQAYPAWVSCSARSNSEISDGTTFGHTMKMLTAPNIIARGVNCTNPEFITGLLTNAEGPFVVYPNAGTWDAINRKWMETADSKSPEDRLQSWLSHDISILGGCCGLSADFIVAITKQVN